MPLVRLVALNSLAVVLSLLSYSAAQAQISNVTNATSTPIPGSGHDLIQMLSESVDPANGSLSIRVAIPQPKARAFVLPFAFTYDSNSAGLIPVSQSPGRVIWAFNQNVFAVGQWSNTLPQLSSAAISYADPLHPGNTCRGTSGYVFQDSAGGRHALNLSGIETPGAAWCLDSGWQAHTTAGDNYLSAWIGNLSGGNFYQAGNGEVRVADHSGTVYDFVNSVTHAWGSCSSASSIGYAMPGTMEDTNGNVLTISNPCGGNFTVTDTAGRAALSIQSASGQVTSVTVPGLATAYTPTWVTATPSGKSLNAVQITSDTHCSGVPNWGGPAISRISTITLPNGKQYQFTYDAVYGTISKITYPSGGYVSYAWGLNAQSAVVTYPDSTNASNACQYRYDRPAILHRYVSFDGATIARQDDFAYSTTWAGSNQYTWTAKQTTVTSHDFIANTTVQTVYSYTPGNAPFAPNMPTNYSELQMPLEQTIAHKNSLGQTLMTTTKGWSPTIYGYLLNCEFQTLDDGQISAAYGLFPESTDKKEYDYGLVSSTSSCQAPPGINPTRETIVSYQAFPATPLFPSAPSILNKPASVSTYGNGVLLAQTLTSYDQVAVTDVSNLPAGTHDETNYGPVSSAPRGNPTTITRKCLQSCSDAITTSTFDKTGQLLSRTDPCGNVTCSDITGSNHTTTYSYSDNFDSPPSANTNSLLTVITDPLGHTMRFKYAYADSQLISSTDPNNLTTSYTYADSLRRITETDFADGGRTTISYNDSAPSPTITTTKTINLSQSSSTTTVLDGIGHKKQTQVTSDPQGTVFTDTAYDGFGHIRSESNPYRSGTDATTSSGTTTFSYDALGRKIQESLPDSSVITTAYCGASTLVTDPTKRWRRSRKDALGRLVEVDEPNSPTATVSANGCVGTGEPIWITSYTYDALTDLLSVLQNGSHPRSFTYDSLSRLLTSNNPEAGNISYSYDANGNVVTKTDARSITLTKTYDVINREKSTTYSNGDHAVNTNYDESNCLSLSSCQNIGHRTSVTDAAGSESWAYQVDFANSRTIHKNQRTTSAITKTFTYCLDLTGNITQVVYPTGRTVNYTYDNANRPSKAADASNGITYAVGFQTPPSNTACVATAVCYTPQGAPYAISIGQSSTFTGLNLTHVFNARMQPQEFKASSSGGNAMDISYGYTDPSAGGNAGHVFSITNNLDNTRSQNFTYDQVNRITSSLTSSTHATSPAHCWGETYQFDGSANGAWGNLTQIAATTNPAYSGCSQESGFAQSSDGNNRLSGFVYDTAGNALSDGVNAYTWSAESQLKTGGGVTYTYDGEGRRAAKVGSKLYWYGSGEEILLETDSSGSTSAEYIFFGGKRIAKIKAASNPIYYIEDLLGTARVIATITGTICYDADFYPYGGERTPYTNICSQNAYKFEGKERDTETGNDDFGSRYYSNRFGRWLSSDWSAVPVAVPYANLSNPQTLNLYSMVVDDPESFADLDGHFLNHGMNTCVVGTDGGSTGCSPWQTDEIEAAAADAAQQQAAQQQQQNQASGQAGNPLLAIHVDNVGGEGNPKPPITIDSGTVFAITVTFDPNLPSGTKATVDVSLVDSKGKSIPGSEIIYSIESKGSTSSRIVGGQSIKAVDNTFVVKGIVFSRNGVFQQTASASLKLTLADKTAKRAGSAAVAAKVSDVGEVVDRRQAAISWAGAREFTVP